MATEGNPRSTKFSIVNFVQKVKFNKQFLRSALS